ncbi:MAG: 30S ribosomal protein S6 [Pseudonocardiaceae bacterium]
MSRHYEVMIILDPTLDERTVTPTLDTYLNVIRTSGGAVENVEVWGRRRLSFEIRKHTEGIYAVLDLNSTPEAVKELDRQLSLQEMVLRTKVMRREAPKPGSRKLRKPADKPAAKV